MNEITNVPAVPEIKLPEAQSLQGFFRSGDAVDQMIDRIAETVRAHVPDLSTKKGRDAVASLAYNVSKSKTYLDGEGKKLVEGIKAEAAVVDASRKKIRDRLDALRDEARKPLTEWEAADERRRARDKQILSQLTNHGMTGHEPSATIVAKANEIRAIALPDDFGGGAEVAEAARAATMQALRNMYTAAQTREAEAAELEKLRKEAAERAAADEAARIERERAEADRLAAERAEQERKDAEVRAAREAEESAAREKAEAQRIEAARKEAADRAASEAAQRERDRIAAEQRAEAEAQRKREENARIRNRVKRDITAAFSALPHPLTPETVAEALLAGGIPNVNVRF